MDAARLGNFRDRVERGLGVQRVEYGFDQQQIRAAVEQAVDLLAVGGAQVVEGHCAVAGIADVRRDRGGAVGRAECARDKTRLAVLGLGALGGVARQLRAFEIHLIGNGGEIVVGLRDGGGRERVGRDDIRARRQIREVNILDGLRLGQDQQVVIAAQVAVKVLEAFAAERRFVELQSLNHRAHRAIEHEDAFACERAETVGDG